MTENKEKQQIFTTEKQNNLLLQIWLTKQFNL